MFKAMMLALALLTATATSAGPQAASQVEVPVAVQAMVQAYAGEETSALTGALKIQDRVRDMIKLRDQLRDGTCEDCDGEQLMLGNADGELGTGNAYGHIDGVPYGQAKQDDETLLPLGQQIQSGEAEVPGLGNAYGQDPEHVTGDGDGNCDSDGVCDGDGVPDGNAYGHGKN